MKTRHLLTTTCIVLAAATGVNAQSKRDNLHIKRTATNETPVDVARGGACTTWGAPTDSTGWNDFTTQFGGAPCNDGTGCAFNEIQDFEVYESEAYAMAGITAGSSYTFSHCNGPGAGTWVPDYTIIAPSGAIDASGAGDGDGCSITWTATESGEYLIVINEAASCGVEGSTPNGYPAITCTGIAPCPEACEAGTLTVETSQCVEFGEATAEFGVDTATIEIPTGGGYAIGFQPVTGQGTGASAPNGFLATLNGIPPFPVTFDSDFNGLLSANSLEPFAGQWLVVGVVLSDPTDLNSGCNQTLPVTINFVGEDETCEVSAGQLDPSAFSVFPNPNSGQFTVSVTGIQGNATIDVMDLTGKVLHTGQLVMGAESRMNIDLGGHASGLYLVRFTVDGATHVSKVSVN